MPIEKEEFELGEIRNKIEEDLLSFLKDREEGAFTSQELMEGAHSRMDFNTPEVAKISTFTIADFATLLHDMVKEGKVNMKVVRGRMYFTNGKGQEAKCPKCGTSVAAPKKTWKMAGRPDKNGKRLQLHIGLYKCPKHKTFRKVLSKRKV